MSNSVRFTAAEWVTRTRIRLQMRFPWLTEPILSLRTKEVTEGVLSLLMDSYNAPAATDGKIFYYHPTRFLALSEPEALFVYLHEVMHLIFKHPWRMKKRDRDLWNVVTDKLINSLLVKIGLERVEGLLYLPDGFEDTFAEKLYAMYEKAGALEQMQSGEGGEKGRYSGIPVPKRGYYSESKSEGRMATPHDLWGEVEKDTSCRQQWDDVAVRMQGYMPAGIGLDAEIGARVRIPWYRELQLYIKAEVPFDYGPRYMWRKSQGLRYGMRRLESPHLKLALAWDLSGSIGKEQRNRMATETMGIMREFDSYEILMMGCDAAVHGVWHIHPGGRLPLDEIKGGGGTSFTPVFDKIQELDFHPDCLLFFTDSFGTFPSEPPDYPVVWGVVGVQGKVPWGKYLEVILDD